MAKRAKTSLSVDPDLMKAVGHACIDLDIGLSDAMELALKSWLYSKTTKAPPQNEVGDTPQRSRFSTIANNKNSHTIGSQLHFNERLAGLLSAVPEKVLPEAEAYFLRLIEISLPLFSQGRRFHVEAEVRNYPPPIEELEDKPGVVIDVPEKPAKAPGAK